MNKYVYSICGEDQWPTIETVVASSISDAEDKVITKYCDLLEIEDNNYDYLEFQEMLNDQYIIVISDLYDIEEL